MKEGVKWSEMETVIQEYAESEIQTFDQAKFIISNVKRIELNSQLYF